MKLASVILSIALFAGVTSASLYDDDEVHEARSIYDGDSLFEARSSYDRNQVRREFVRSLIEEYEEYKLAARSQCVPTANGGKCSGLTKRLCEKLCTGPPCGWMTGTPDKKMLDHCQKECQCTQGGSKASSPVVAHGRK